MEQAHNRANIAKKSVSLHCSPSESTHRIIIFFNLIIMSNEKEFKIELKPDVAKGSYSNLAIITHSHSEFIIDFATMLPGLPKPEVGNRIIMTPEHAKRLYLALQDNINKYESQHGQISLGGEPKATFPMGGFGGGAKS